MHFIIYQYKAHAPKQIDSPTYFTKIPSMQWQIVGSTTHRIIMHFDNILIKVYFIFRTIRNETDGKCCVIKMCCIMRKCTKLFALHAFAMQFIYNTICAHWMCNPTLSNHFMYSFRHLPFILYFIFSSSGVGVALIYFPFCRHPHSMRFGEVGMMVQHS